MILVISNEGSSVNDICDWLDYFNKPYILIGGIKTRAYKLVYYDNLVNEFTFKDEYYNRYYNTKDIHSIFIRQATLKSVHYYQFNKLKIPKELKTHLYIEEIAINNFFLKNSHKKYVIGNYFRQYINKLEVLEKAKEFKLLVPKSFLVTLKRDLKSILSKMRLINKSISNLAEIKYEDNEVFLNYTEEITLKDLENLPNEFYPSYFQELIKKKYEIRSFYLNNQFYSMAIFSQKDKQTCIDFRKYNYENPNRTVPFKLPKIIENKLKLLINHYNLNTASIDIIVDVKNQYYFLEINPDGQYGMVSSPCNLYLDKIITKNLIKNDEI